MNIFIKIMLTNNKKCGIILSERSINQMENFSTEIISLICDTFSDDKQLVMDMLRYLHFNTLDSKMKKNIEDIFLKEGYCVDCGTKLKSYDYQDGNIWKTELICPNCNEFIK
jgi:hypothetical protein